MRLQIKKKFYGEFLSLFVCWIVLDRPTDTVKAKTCSFLSSASQIQDSALDLDLLP